MADGRLTLGPAWAQVPKIALTRWRTARWRRRAPGPQPGLRILFYHRVSPDPDVLAVTPARFREQVELLAAEGYRVVDVAEAARLLAAGEGHDGVVALCFDDGYRDIAGAVGQLERHGFRASVFVATGVVDGHATFSWYDRQPPVLGWSEIVALDRGSPLRFEAHTVTHPNLRALDAEAVRAEIAGSRAVLEARLGRAVEGFCYPGGLFGPRERAVVEEAGFRFATSCEPGANLPGQDPLALHRIQVDARDRLADFRAKVEGACDRSSLARDAYRRVRYAPPRAARASR
jgi:peptidoglycan/xylan/chitin deacetylase (PgdA/CDA1 family)